VQNAGDSIDSLTASATSSSSSSEVHTWVDEYGVTHYSTSAPTDRQSETIRVNPNSNVVASVPKREARGEPEFKKAFSDKLPESASAATSNKNNEQGPVIPGTDGLRLPVNLNRDELTEFLNDSQRPSPERLGVQ